MSEQPKKSTLHRENNTFRLVGWVLFALLTGIILSVRIWGTMHVFDLIWFASQLIMGILITCINLLGLFKDSEFIDALAGPKTVLTNKGPGNRRYLYIILGLLFIVIGSVGLLHA